MKNFITTFIIGMCFLVTTANAEVVITRKGIVIQTEDLSKRVVTTVPKHSCSTISEPIYGNRTTGSGNAGESALGGMIIGGILGKAIGGNDKGAAAGAILGGVIGADKGQKKTERVIIGYNEKEVCRTIYVDKVKHVNNGYKITVEVPSLDRYRYTFESDVYLEPGTEVEAKIKLGN